MEVLMGDTCASLYVGMFLPAGACPEASVQRTFRRGGRQENLASLCTQRQRAVVCQKALKACCSSEGLV